MAITRTATFKPGKSSDAIIIEADDKKISVSQLGAAGKTEKQIKDLITDAASLSSIALPPIFVHRNLTGSVALATGQAPDVWPEDAPADEVE